MFVSLFIIPEMMNKDEYIYYPARHRGDAGGLMFYRCYFFKCRPSYLTTDGRIATQIVA